MAEMISALQDLQRRLGGVVLVVHHSGKDPTKGMRGWTGIRAAMDFIIACERPDREVDPPEAKFVLEKVKDGDDGKSFDFTMKRHALYENEDGSWETSLTVVRPDSDAPRQRVLPPDEAAIATADDAFVDAWVRRVVKGGQRPTGRWLEAELVKLKEEGRPTQKRLRDAITRLKGIGRLDETIGGPGGAKWLCPIDPLPGEAP
jgi:hypothetical protein